MSRPIGTCALCGLDGVQLCDSHVIPRWAWQRIRESAPSNPIPVKIENGRAVQIDDQVSEYMLCDTCEQNLAEEDDYASKLAYTRNETPLVGAITFVDGAEGERIRVAELNSSIDVGRLCRFAAAVFWRGHVARSIPECSVGEHYAARLRGYLRGAEPFPKELSLTMALYVPARDGRNHLATAIRIPKTTRERGYFGHEFVVCGLQFLLATGRTRPDWYRELCLVHTETRFIRVCTHDVVREGLLELVTSSRPVGRLAKQSRARTT